MCVIIFFSPCLLLHHLFVCEFQAYKGHYFYFLATEVHHALKKSINNLKGGKVTSLTGSLIFKHITHQNIILHISNVRHRDTIFVIPPMQQYICNELHITTQPPNLNYNRLEKITLPYPHISSLWYGKHKIQEQTCLVTMGDLYVYDLKQTPHTSHLT